MVANATAQATAFYERRGGPLTWADMGHRTLVWPFGKFASNRGRRRRRGTRGWSGKRLMFRRTGFPVYIRRPPAGLRQKYLVYFQRRAHV